VHGCNGLPAVPAQIKTLSAGHTHGAVIATDAVQVSIGGGHSAAASAGRHAGHRLPAANPGIKPLHTRLVVGRIEAAQANKENNLVKGQFLNTMLTFIIKLNALSDKQMLGFS